MLGLTVIAVAQSPIALGAFPKKLITGFQFTEGPCWRAQGCLVFSDISASTVYRWDATSGIGVLLHPSGSANGLAEDGQGRLLMAQQGSRQLARLESNGQLTILASSYQGKKLNSPNDLVVHSNGSIYFTDPPYGIQPSQEELGFNGVYYLAADGTGPVLLVDNLKKPNGIALSPDEEVLYICDTDAGRIRAYDLQTDGSAANGRDFVVFSDGSQPDGMTVDPQGRIYVACSDAGLKILSPEAEILDQITLPERTRNVVIGGSGGNTLFIAAGSSIYSLSLDLDGETTLRLPDTGQSGDYTPVFGEDSDYAINPPAYRDNGDGTVTDLITGLIWQQLEGGEMTWENAQIYAQNLNLCGFTDWRLPESQELFNLVDHSTFNPALNATFFPKTAAEYWWTVEPRADDASHVWVVNAGGGIGAHPKNETISAGGSRRFHVRCVRGAVAVMATSRFIDHGDGTVTDQLTGLTWSQVETDVMTWEAALTFSENLSLGGLSDWRLPNIKELRSISDDAYYKPSLLKIYFPNAQSGKYWSSTSEANQSSRAWYVDFTYGLVSYEDKLSRLPIRCVRGGLAVSSSVPEPSGGSPQQWRLYPIYPNPFNSTAQVTMELKTPANLQVCVFNLMGQQVAELAGGQLAAGLHTFSWQASGQASGTYFVRVLCGVQCQVQKCFLLR